MRVNPSFGPRAVYSPEQLARFAEWRPAREAVAPTRCLRAERCWALHGPPCWSPKDGENCLGCGGMPRTPRSCFPR